MELQLEKAFKKTINQTIQLCTCHKANKKGFFSFCFRRKPLGNHLPLSKKPLNQIGGQLRLVQIQPKKISDTQVDFSAAETPVTVSVTSKAKQKLVVSVVEWETSKESTSVTESDGVTEPSEAQFSLCSELGAAAFLTSHQLTAVSSITRALFAVSWPNSTWGNYVLPT